MRPTPEESAAADLKARTEAAFPELLVMVEDYDYGDKLRIKLTEPRSERVLKLRDLSIDGISADDRSALVRQRIRAWLADS